VGDLRATRGERLCRLALSPMASRSQPAASKTVSFFHLSAPPTPRICGEDPYIQRRVPYVGGGGPLCVQQRATDGFAVGLGRSASLSRRLEIPISPLCALTSPRCAADWCKVGPPSASMPCPPDPGSGERGLEGATDAGSQDCRRNPRATRDHLSSVSAGGCSCRLTVRRGQRGPMIGAMLKHLWSPGGAEKERPNLKWDGGPHLI
jgi:hypothetical protein